MTVHSVRPQDLIDCRTAVNNRATAIATELTALGGSVAEQEFIGGNADKFAEELQLMITDFVATQMANLNEILTTVHNNMNVVVSKLGGDPFPLILAEGLAGPTDVKARQSTEGEQRINTATVGSYGGELTGYMTRISGEFSLIGPTDIGTSPWEGPEKDATVDNIIGQVTTVTDGINLTGEAMAKAINDQVEAMGSGGAGGGAPVGGIQ